VGMLPRKSELSDQLQAFDQNSIGQST